MSYRGGAPPRGLAGMDGIDRSRIQVWSTQSVPERERLDYYASALAEAITPMAVGSDCAAAFTAEIQSIGLGPIDVLRCTGAPHHVIRGSRELARGGARMFHLLVNCSSRMLLRHRGDASLPSGSAVLVDSDLGHRLILPQAYEVAHLRLAEGFVRKWLVRPEALVGRCLPADAGWSAALCAVVRQLSPTYLVGAPLPSAVLADHVGALLALVGAELCGGDAVPSSADRSLRERIEACIQLRCHDASLTARDVAASVSVSTRTVHRALAACGETFGGLLMSARRRVALRMLDSRQFDRLTIAEIARRAGFTDPSHFARAIRQHSGRSPREIRAARQR